MDGGPGKTTEQALAAALAVDLGYVSESDLAGALEALARRPGPDLLDHLFQVRLIDEDQRREIERKLANRLQADQPTVDQTAATGMDETVEFDGVLEPNAPGTSRKGPTAPSQADAELRVMETGRYAGFRVHGRGGQATIYLAYDRQIGREVALKQVQLDEFSDEPESSTPAETGSASPQATAIQRFLREARVTGQLEHPNITPIHELGRTSGGDFYYTMRFIRGETLAAKLAKCKDLPDRLKLLGSFWDLCNAITFAHSRSVVHRDIKPGNVIIGDHGQTVVVDWGIAKFCGQVDDLTTSAERLKAVKADDSATMVGSIIGTPAYMSPEQARGDVDVVDERSDVWALGVVLYQILTGSKPFRGSSSADTLTLVTEQRLVPVHQLCPQAPPELAAVAERALRKDRDQRYRTAAGLSEDISAYMTGGRVRAYAYGSWELVKRFAARNKIAVTAAGLVLIVIIASLIAVAFALRSESRAREAELAAHLQASYHLAHAFDDKARQMMGEHRYTTAAVFGAAALVNNPAHAGSPQHDPDFGRNHPDSRELLLQSASRLFRLSFETRAQLVRAFSYGAATNVLDLAPDGRRLAAAGFGGKIRIWDWREGRLLHTLEGHTERLYGLAFSPDGGLLASGGRDGTIRLWNPSTGRPVWTTETQHLTIQDLAFSSDGTRLVSSHGDGSVLLWEASSGQLAASLPRHANRANAVDISPDGKWVAAGTSTGSVRLSSVQGKTRVTWKAHRLDVMSLRFSPDGELLATSGLDGLVVLWSIPGAAKVREIRAQENGISRLVFSPDGRWLATGGYDNTIHLYEADTGRLVTAIDAHGGFTTGLDFSDDGAALASGSFDRTVKIWQISRPRALLRLPADPNGVYTWEFSPDGRWIASSGWSGLVRIWDAEDGSLRHDFRAHKELVLGVRFTPDSRRLLTVGREMDNRLWDVETGAMLGSLGPSGRTCTDASFHPDGRSVVMDSAGSDAEVFDTASNAVKITLKGHTDLVQAVAFSPDGKRLATGSSDHTARIWDAASGRPLRTLKGHTDWVTGVAFSPDGTRLATASKDGLAKVWDSTTGKPLMTLSGHRAWVNTVYWSPDGSLLATASDDHTARLWSAVDGKPLQILFSRIEVARVAFSPDGSKLLLGDGEEVVVYPVDFTYRKKDPELLLDEAERSAGVEFDGIEARLIIPTRAEDSPRP